MSVDAIPHGLKGYRMGCPCDVCKRGWADYVAERRAIRKAKADKRSRKSTGTDDLAKRRAQKRTAAPRKRSESNDSVGAMEAAVIAECDALENKPNATQLVAAKQLASLIDKLSANGDGAGAAIINSSTKQLMSIMAEMRGDTVKAKATGRRKSGGRLATVGALTKVKRQGA